MTTENNNGLLGGIKKLMAALALLFMVAGCSAWGQQGYVEARAVTANYTEMYVDYTFYDTKGRNLGLGGGANPFSKGGTGGSTCCATLPGPGQTVRVVWDEETPNRNKEKTYHYSRDVVVIGSAPLPGDSYNYVITRFFPGQQLEVELVSEPMGGGRSPRLDQLFYGRGVMRRIGE
ncbi:hypothetical protein HDG34_003153 [Paraburkholderia sp. HC6.4b]|uniref:DUF3304 domain-containing protein n=1 Tax=unclassified Paraburkholderia TaxID=2615204 RepID=UPI0016125C92|nr:MULTISPECIES: DUF3304 domain-containing protein [unclassified Paraburkholderia]MBB5409212.1 hypothetical protein [Paraburkholderia sp. HC6.4b]MBB5450940.1 hypothetical protein [Paraburkholderia sp. Kb1A]